MSRICTRAREHISTWLVLLLVIGAGELLMASDGKANLHTQRHQVRYLINQERVGSGVKKIRHSRSLTHSAQLFAEELMREDRFAHDARIHAGHQWWWLGEVLAKGQKTPMEVVQAWMGSPAHRNILLDKRAQAMGVGRSGNIWVAHFGMLGP